MTLPFNSSSCRDTSRSIALSPAGVPLMMNASRRVGMQRERELERPLVGVGVQDAGHRRLRVVLDFLESPAIARPVRAAKPKKPAAGFAAWRRDVMQISHSKRQAARRGTDWDLCGLSGIRIAERHAGLGSEARRPFRVTVRRSRSSRRSRSRSGWSASGPSRLLSAFVAEQCEASNGRYRSGALVAMRPS